MVVGYQNPSSEVTSPLDPLNGLIFGWTFRINLKAPSW